MISRVDHTVTITPRVARERNGQVNHTAAAAPLAWSSLGGSDTLAAVQWNAARGAYRWSAVHKLCLAVLIDARTCAQSHDTRTIDHRRDRKEAREWFAARDDGGVFSFVSICHLLGIDAERVRASILSRGKKARHRYRRYAAVDTRMQIK